MIRTELISTFSSEEITIDEPKLVHLLPDGSKIELNEKHRTLNILNPDSDHLLSQERFTKNEWIVMKALIAYYPHYVPYEVLLACVTSLPLDMCCEIIQEAQQAGTQALKRELKPVYRALSGTRAKFSNLSSPMKISLIRELGYSLTTSVG